MKNQHDKEQCRPMTSTEIREQERRITKRRNQLGLMCGRHGATKVRMHSLDGLGLLMQCGCVFQLQGGEMIYEGSITPQPAKGAARGA